VRSSVPFESRPPLFVEPVDRQRSADLSEFLDWLKAKREALEAALLVHGAVVFRGFPFRETEDFERLVDLYPPHSQSYAGGGALRKAIKGRVMETTRIAPSVYLKMHQEMSYLPKNPRLLTFFCRKPAESGGATVIADMRRVTAALPRELLHKFEEKGVRYMRNLLSPDVHDERTNPLFGHNNWVANFGTSDRAAVEEACRERGLKFAWRDDGSLDISNQIAGVTRHPVTGERLYFNQAHVMIARHHAYGAEDFARLNAVYGDSPRGYDAAFGDGTAISDSELDSIYAALEDEAIAFPWQAGDVMFVENKLVAHGRHPFTGQRDVQVALID
jgi:alpha-ketoglutarate-dependent taurine dioxygenase